MSVKTEKISLSTNGRRDVVDITAYIQDAISKNGIKDGIAVAFVPGSTGAITTIEFEPGLQKDFPDTLNEIAPKEKYYAHHETWHDDNGRSHVKASLMGPSITIPFHHGKLIHGTWQQVVFIDFDTRPRNRKIIVQIIGK